MLLLLACLLFDANIGGIASSECGQTSTRFHKVTSHKSTIPFLSFLKFVKYDFLSPGSKKHMPELQTHI
jgi:hypothetical protein